MKLVSKLIVMAALLSFGPAAWACTGSCAPRENNPEPKLVDTVTVQPVR